MGNLRESSQTANQNVWNLYRIYFEKFVSWLKVNIYLDEIRDVDESRRMARRYFKAGAGIMTKPVSKKKLGCTSFIEKLQQKTIA